MKLDDAIDLSKAASDDMALQDMPRFAEAIRLGIEALKYRKAEKDAGHLDQDDLLPGETK